MTPDSGWYYAQDDATFGPYTVEELVEKLPDIEGLDTMVFGPPLTDWLEARHVSLVADRLRGTEHLPPVPEARSDEIDYEIFGDEMQYVEITLDPGETVLAEAGAMMFCTAGIDMQTMLGDPAAHTSTWTDRLLAAGSCWVTGESFFITSFSNTAQQREKVAFASPYAGKLVPLHLDQLGQEVICQKDAFVCAAKGVELGAVVQKRIGVGLFGGEGFVMQSLSGDGIAIIHAGGMLMHRHLEAGETLRLDTGCLVALTPDVNFDVELVGGVRNALFGGEGVCFATLTGPGQIWCQSLPFTRLAGRMWTFARRGEGSVLGPIGRVLRGDNGG